MASILTIGDARKAIRLPESDTSKDGDLQDTYIPATEAVVEDLLGPVMQAERTYVADGGTAAIMLPALNITSVDSVTESDVALVAEVDYVANLAAGIVFRGTQTASSDYLAGRQSVSIGYTAGIYATSAAVPANIRLAARIILTHLWQADQQGYRPDFGNPESDTVTTTPSGFSIPRRAAELLGSRSSNRPVSIA